MGTAIEAFLFSLCNEGNVKDIQQTNSLSFSSIMASNPKSIYSISKISDRLLFWVLDLSFFNTSS